MRHSQDSSARIQEEIDNLRVELEGERELLHQHVGLLVQQNLTLAECTREQLDLWVASILKDSMTFAVNSFISSSCFSVESCKSSGWGRTFLDILGCASFLECCSSRLLPYSPCFTLVCCPTPEIMWWIKPVIGSSGRPCLTMTHPPLFFLFLLPGWLKSCRRRTV